MSAWDDESIAKLVPRLTLEQKVAQLAGLSVTDLIDRAAQPPGARSPVIDPGRVAGLRPHGVGSFSLAWFLGHDADSLRAALESAQTAVREVSPFGIGALAHNEAINGFLHSSGSQFPTAWAQAATWAPDLVRRAAAVSAAHMIDSGIHLAFAPVMDINRDPRWGRVHETYGEDPELVAQFSVAFVRGMQGVGRSGVLAAGKHFLGYGASEGGLNQAATQLGRRALADEYAMPFRRAIDEAGLVAVMNSYNEIDGVPAVANRWMLTELLREQLGFDGLVVSDYDAVPMLLRTYHTASTPGQAAVQALTAGLDVDLPWGEIYGHAVDEVRAGRLDEAVVDRAVFRVLQAKARVGLIPEFSPPPAGTRVLPDAGEAAAVRRAVADRGNVLLTNDGTLPLSAGAQRVVVVGPAADELRIHFAAYTSVSQAEMPIGMMAVMTGQVPGVDPANFIFTDLFQTRMPGMEPVFEQAARDLHPGMTTVVEALRQHDGEVRFAPLGTFAGAPGGLTAGAVAAAVGDADVVVAVVGERTGWVGNNTAGEGQASASPVLPGDQERLIELLAASGRPVVTVVVSGRPLLLEPVVRSSSAVLLAPLLGEEGPRAIADVLYGVVNPSGKLPSTFPRAVGQLPIYHGHHFGSGYAHPTGTRHGYNDLAEAGPLFAFGHGGSYTSFDLRFDEDSPVPAITGTAVTAHVVVTNTGDRAGETVVQLYARDEEATVVRPVRQLLDFSRVALAPGESRTISFAAPLDRLAYTMLDGRRGFEAGDVTVMAGLAADDLRCTATVSAPALP